MIGGRPPGLLLLFRFPLQLALKLLSHFLPQPFPHPIEESVSLPLGLWVPLQRLFIREEFRGILLDP